MQRTFTTIAERGFEMHYTLNITQKLSKLMWHVDCIVKGTYLKNQARNEIGFGDMRRTLIGEIYDSSPQKVGCLRSVVFEIRAEYM